MKFIHTADIHIGGWRDSRLRETANSAFNMLIFDILKQEVDFILISGDLFDTSFPSIESIKLVVSGLRKLKDAGIRVYSIAGSHDYSPTGKTLLDVLEEARLLRNVDTKDQYGNPVYYADETGANITGISGRKNMLDRADYINLSFTGTKGFNIFLFHNTLDELKPKEMDQVTGMSVSLLPKGFDYYAGGHVHIVEDVDIAEYKNIVYPGPLFPNNFSELEKLKYGGYYLYDSGKLSYNAIKIRPVVCIEIDCENKDSQEINDELLALNSEVKNSIVLLRLKGTIRSGRISDIELNNAVSRIYAMQAYFVMRNTRKLLTKDSESVLNQFQTEEEMISEFTKGSNSLEIGLEKQKELVCNVMKNLDTEKNEGEKNADYEQRIISLSKNTFDHFLQE